MEQSDTDLLENRLPKFNGTVEKYNILLLGVKLQLVGNFPEVLRLHSVYIGAT